MRVVVGILLTATGRQRERLKVMATTKLATTKRTVRQLTWHEEDRVRRMQWYLTDATTLVSQLREVVEMLPEQEARKVLNRVGVSIVTLGYHTEGAYISAGVPYWKVNQRRPGRGHRRRQPVKRSASRVLKLAVSHQDDR